MAEEGESSGGLPLGTKSRHVLGQMWLGLKRGAQLGAIGGAIIGVGALFIGSTAVSVPAFLGYLALGTLTGSMFGMNAGGYFGAIKGLFTRARPNGDALVREAEGCAPQQLPPAPEAPGQAQQQEGGKDAGEISPDDEKAPAAASVSVVTPQNPQPGVTISQEALGDLQKMTQALQQIQANAKVAGQQQPTPQVAGDWRQRAIQQRLAAQQLEMADRPR